MVVDPSTAALQRVAPAFYRATTPLTRPFAVARVTSRVGVAGDVQGRASPEASPETARRPTARGADGRTRAAVGQGAAVPITLCDSTRELLAA